MTKLTHKGGKRPPLFLCSICQLPVLPEGPTGWNGGHNAQPVNDGKCCAACDTAVVQVARINLLRLDALLRHEMDQQDKVLNSLTETAPQRRDTTEEPKR
jgi:hypothetical protein